MTGDGAPVIDARSLRCPWPAIRAARAIRDGARSVVVLADDPGAAQELKRVAGAAGLILHDEGAGRFRIAASTGKISFTPAP